MASRRVLGAVLGVVLLLAGLLLGLYGLFAILYGGDSGGNGNTYVALGGHEIDADLVGPVAPSLRVLVTSRGGHLSERQSPEHAIPLRRAVAEIQLLSSRVEE